jgi:hypothetical protein
LYCIFFDLEKIKIVFDDFKQRDEYQDIEGQKKILDQMRVLKKPFLGIVSGYHDLGYRVLGPESIEGAGSVQISGRLFVSPKLVWTPADMEKTFGDMFEDTEMMDSNLVGRVFAFPKRVSGNFNVESEHLRVTQHEWSPDLLIEKVMEELMSKEITDTAVISTPNVRFYPLAIQRFIHEILVEEFS